MTNSTPTPTYCAVLTPPGRGAVATIAVVGPHAIELVDRLFVPIGKTPLAARPPNTIAYGHWANADPADKNDRDQDDPDQAVREDVIVALRHSEQFEQRIEVHCHGGVAASQAIIASLVQRGAVQATWQQLVVREQPDRLRADALIALASAPTERTARILLDQYHGALSNEIASIENSLRGVGERPFNSDLRRQILNAPREAIQQLLALAPLGQRLTTPWRVVLAGPPNVGKSSLINAIVGYQRSIVFDQPGTTRDVVTATTAIDGWPIELSDTAGLRASDDALESQGVERAERQLALADLIVLVFDVTGPLAEIEQRLIDRFPTAMIVLNKVDLVDKRVAARIPPIAMGGLGMSDQATTDVELNSNGLLAAREPLRVSATTGEGLRELMAKIVNRLIPRVPSVGTAVPFTPEQRAGLEQAVAAIERDELSLAVEILSQLTRGR